MTHPSSTPKPERPWARRAWRAGFGLALIAVAVSVAATRPSTTTTRPAPAAAPIAAVTASRKAIRIPGHFSTLPPGAPLPNDAESAQAVRPAPEVRSANAGPNATRGKQKHLTDYPEYARVTGDFVGSTDEILQWVACKWGIDEDIVRAQAAKESWWFQSAKGDWTANAAICPPSHPIGADGRPGQCPESNGLLQIRWQYFTAAYPEVETSTAYNADVAYAVWRACFEGRETWLNTVERGKDYAAGDVWGCVGRWFSGRWYTQPSLDYIAAVTDYLNQRIWTTPDFLSA